MELDARLGRRWHQQHQPRLARRRRLASIRLRSSASLEYGRYQDGDANALAKKFVGGGFDGNRALDRVGYEFVNAHLGLDFGFRNVVFFLHGGVTMIRGHIDSLDAVTAGASATRTTEVVVREDPNFKVVGPSFKLGLLVYVW